MLYHRRHTTGRNFGARRAAGQKTAASWRKACFFIDARRTRRATDEKGVEGHGNRPLTTSETAAQVYFETFFMAGVLSSQSYLQMKTLSAALEQSEEIMQWINVISADSVC